MDFILDIATFAVYDSSINDIVSPCVPWSVWKYKDREKTETKTGTISNTNQTFLIVTPDEKDHKILRPGMISPTNTVLLAMAIIVNNINDQ